MALLTITALAFDIGSSHRQALLLSQTSTAALTDKRGCPHRQAPFQHFGSSAESMAISVCIGMSYVHVLRSETILTDKTPFNIRITRRKVFGN